MRQFISREDFDYLIKEGEGYYLEFKENVSKDIAREMVAFANASGGRIFLGIDDRGELKKIKISNKLKSQIQDYANNCQPRISIKLEEHNDTLIIFVPEGDNKPYQCSEGFFLRMGASSQKMNREQLLDFIEKEGRIKFEELFHHSFDFEKHFIKTKLDNFLHLAKLSTDLDYSNILCNLGVAEK
jgi:ATP-dependent DNA helicase RecG